MNNRPEIQMRFLNAAGWQGSTSTPLAGDASSRSYQRLIHPKTKQSAILMNAPIDTAGPSDSFVAVANYLSSAGLSAPRIFAQDLDHGFILLEDLGDAVFANVITNLPKQERPLYKAAIDVIAHLHNHPNPELPIYGADQMAAATDLAFLHYSQTPSATLKNAAKAAIGLLSEKLAQLGDYNCVSLRDFHAENLIWLEDREGINRVGLLDFQDAVQTHPAYDLMSLIRDARRDVSPDVADEMVTYFCKRRGFEEASFRQDASLISAQRNLRILGIFARLSKVMHKPHYVDLIPRVWHNLQADLAHPALSDLHATLSKILPEPTPEFLNHLRTP